MKKRITLVVLTVCFFNIFTFADNPTDAPLLPETTASKVAPAKMNSGQIRDRRSKKMICSSQTPAATDSKVEGPQNDRKRDAQTQQPSAQSN